MKLKHVGALALCGMMATSMSVFALTHDETSAIAQDGLAHAVLTAQRAAPALPLRIAETGTLKLAGRLSRTTLRQHADGKAFLLIEVAGPEHGTAPRAPVHMALVLDRSGSMSGDRMTQAKAAARGVVERMQDGDVVTVVSFDTATELAVPPTVLSGASRSSVLSAIDQIALGGDTCVSCGIAQAMKELAGHQSGPTHMIVLSDGKTNHGVRETEGLRSLAMACGSRGVAVTTVGMGLDYEEDKLAAIADASNGRHHFVESTASLPALFEAEAKSLAATLATDAKIDITLRDGVRLVSVLDRDHAPLSASQFSVSLGALARGETKTVLIELEVPTHEAGSRPVADVALSYAEVADAAPARLDGALGVVVDHAGQASMDPVVQARLERSRTSSALEEANALLRKGKVAEASARIERREQQLETAAAAAKSAGGAREKEVEYDFEDQKQSTSRAKGDLAPKPKGKRGGCGCAGADLMCNMRCSQKKNGADASDMRR